MVLIGETQGVPGDANGGGEPVDRDPPSEEVLWKSRALEAEEKLEACGTRVGELEGELSSARDALASVERRAEIERALGGSGAVDLETAVMLVESALSSMDEPDVGRAVRELRARKPFLFGGGDGGLSSAMGARRETGDDGIGELATRARGSGDRRELLRYLRARRRG